MSEDIEDVAEKLEKDEEEIDSWDVAHHKYENGEEEMLENMVHSFGLAHKYQAWDGLMTKKGEYIDYDEWHATSWSALLIGGAYIAPSILSGVFITLWFLVVAVIVKHSYSNQKGTDPDHWIGSLQEFGFELPYYAGAAVVTTYMFETFTEHTIAIDNFGLIHNLLNIVLTTVG